MSDFSPVRTGKGQADPAMCGRCGLDRTKPNKEQRMYAPCWNCIERDSQGHVTWLSPQGCANCEGRRLLVDGSTAPLNRRRDVVCDRCGVYVSRWGLLYNGDRLPPGAFDRYPAGWRIAYFAVFGAPAPMYLPIVRSHLRDLANLHFVNTVRRELQLEPYPEFADARAEFLERYQYATQGYVRANDIRRTIDNVIEKFSKPAIEVEGMVAKTKPVEAGQ